LVARAAEARDVLPRALAERGADVDVLPLYDTVTEPLGDDTRQAAATADYVTFTSSSTVRYFVEAMDGSLLAGPRTVSIGPVAIVDPQVGTERRALAVRCADGRILVGPDNGVLSLAWQRAGGAVEAVDITRSRHRLEPVSATFHGRDMFAPVAAHLASGSELA